MEYHGIDERKLFVVLDQVINGNGIPEIVTDEERSILTGTLVDVWETGCFLTELGKVFLCELTFRSCRNYQGDE